MSFATLADVIEQVVTVIRAVDGIRFVPDTPPDQIAAWPVVRVYPSQGYVDSKDFGIGFNFHDIACEVLVPHKDLARDMAVLIPFIDSVPKALSTDPTLNSIYGQKLRISYTICEGKIGEVETIGYRFIIEKIKLDPYGK